MVVVYMILDLFANRFQQHEDMEYSQNWLVSQTAEFQVWVGSVVVTTRDGCEQVMAILI